MHRIHTALDNNSRKEVFAVVANMIDWNSAFVRQCPKQGIKSFQENGVRSTLIPLLISYFQERHQSVKWMGVITTPRRINGGGPQGVTLGILEYLSQSNNSADCVGPDDRFKFVDDLTILEIVNLLTIGLSSYNVKHQVPNDIGEDNHFIPPDNLKSQEYLNEINEWTKNKEMMINQAKSKTMLFNFTTKYQFNTRLKINNQILETVKETRLLGTVITSDLKWDRNTNDIVKRAYTRMDIIRKLKNFEAPYKDLKHIYIVYVRSLLEQSSNVWHSSLTIQNKNDLERVQKVALKIILGSDYKTYSNALNFLDLETLNERREHLCLQFAKKCLKNPKMKHLFPLNNRTHEMIPRQLEHFQIDKVNTNRLKDSTIPYMQNLLNIDMRRKIEQNILWNS